MKPHMNRFIISLSAGMALAVPGISFAANGAVPQVLKPSAEYKDVLSKRTYDDTDRSAFLAEATLKMQTRGINVVSMLQKTEGNAQGKGNEKAIDAVYATPDYHQMVFLTLGVEPKQKKLNGNLLPVADGYFYHDTTESGIPFVAYFSAFSSEEALDTLHDFSSMAKVNSPEQGRFAQIWNTLIPNAMAADCIPAGAKPINAGIIADILGPINSNPYSACAFNAAVQFGMGGGIGLLKNGVGKSLGLGVLAAYNVYSMGHLILHPEQTLTDAGKDLAKFRKTIDEYNGDLARITGHYVVGWDKLSPTRKTTILCGMSGAFAGFVAGHVAGASARSFEEVVKNDLKSEQRLDPTIALNDDGAAKPSQVAFETPGKPAGGGAVEFETPGVKPVAPGVKSKAVEFEEAGTTTKPNTVTPAEREATAAKVKALSEDPAFQKMSASEKNIALNAATLPADQSVGQVIMYAHTKPKAIEAMRQAIKDSKSMSPKMKSDANAAIDHAVENQMHLQVHHADLYAALKGEGTAEIESMIAEDVEKRVAQGEDRAHVIADDDVKLDQSAKACNL
jgi:hypothetical protein